MKEISTRRTGRLPGTENLEPEYGQVSQADGIQLSHYWNVLVKRRWIIIVLFLIVFVPGVYFAVTATKLYTASATIKIEPQNPQVTGVASLQPLEGSWGEYDYYKTQFALLKSRPLAARVIMDPGLESNNVFASSHIIRPDPLDHVTSWVNSLLRYFSGYMAPLFRSAQETESQTIKSLPSLAIPENDYKVSPRLISRYLGFINIAPVQKTRLVKVEFTTPDPALSEALANAHSQGFMQMSLENRFTLTKEARDFLDQKKIELRRRLEDSEAALNDFRRAHGVVSVDKGENIVVDRWLDLNKQLTAARAQRIESESLYRTVESQNNQDLGDVMKQGLIQQLKGNVATLEAERARVSTVFKPDHPRMQELNQQITAAVRELNNEIAHVVRGIRSNYAAATAKERGLQAEVDKQQRDALRLRELGVDYTLLQEEVNANRSLYESVLKRLSETNVSSDIAISNMQIVERAVRPLNPSEPKISLYILASTVSGLFFGIGFAFIREYFDSTVSNSDDIWRAVGLGTLGVVPHLKYLNESVDSGPEIRSRYSEREPRGRETEGPAPTKELMINHRPHSFMSESYRNIRTSLLLSQPDKPPQVILVTSPSPKEGKTVTSLNLAIAFAQDGYSTLLIDGDMRMGCCHERLGMSNNRGLSNVLTGRLSLAEGIQPTLVSGLSLLSRGIPPPNPSELLGSRRMKEIVRELRERYEFIFIDSPPAIAISDAAIVSVLTDGVVLVFDGETTSTPYAQKAVERLDTVRARLLGVVLNGVNLNNPAYSYYRTYSSYYGHNEANAKDSDNPVHTPDLADQLRSFASKTAAAAKDVMRGLKRETVENGRVNRSENAAGVRNKALTDDADDLENRTLKTVQAASLKERTQPAAVLVDDLSRLIEALTKAIGPVAPQIIREQMAMLGESRYSFPDSRIDGLLELIERELTDDEWTLFSTYYFPRRKSVLDKP